VKASSFLHRFQVRGVFWRQGLTWAVNHVPYYFEPLVMMTWSFLFMFMAIPARRAIMKNLRHILPGSTTLGNLVRSYRVFLNFAWSIADTARFNESKGIVDWEFIGYENLQRLVASDSGAIILTAHMGNYDLGSYLFTERLKRPMRTVRAPETDAETQRWVEKSRAKREDVEVNVDYNIDTTSLAFDLLNAIRDNQIVAIQGDRVVEGIAGAPVRFFGIDTEFPSGPFALAMATQAPIYPLFVIRKGRRRYCVRTEAPMYCVRQSRDRDCDLAKAMEQWRDIVEAVVRDSWYQWFMFYPISREVS
jgi:Lauroyl/myristoyl acyltransferase